METNRNEHTPTTQDSVSALAVLKSIFRGQGVRDIAAEAASHSFPGLKGYLEGLKTFKQEYDINYIDCLVEAMHRDGLLTEENIETLADKLDRHEGVMLYVGHCVEITDRSHSKRAKAILALYSARVIAEPELLNDPESAFMLDVLSSVNDFDITHFEMMTRCMNEYREPQLETREAYSRIARIDMIDPELTERGLVSFQSSIQKLIGLQALERISGTWGSFNNVIVGKSPYTESLEKIYDEYKRLYEKTQEHPSK